MSTTKKKGPTFDPGLCRCCGSMKKCRVLNVEYEWLGQKEVYSDMMMDCFGLLLSHLDSKMTERLVCATCVTRLRDALSFRRQVLRCEEAFLLFKMGDDDDDTCDLKKVDLDLESSGVEVRPQVEVDIVKMELSEGEPGEGEPGEGEPDEKVVSDGEIKDTSSIDDLLKDELNNDSNDDLPLQRLATKPCKREKVRSQGWWLKQRNAEEKPKLPISKVQELNREKDSTYMIDTNIISIVEYSYVCPFKCRHNNLHCYYCGQTFLDPSLLREHTAAHNPSRFKVADHKNMVKVDLTRIDCRLCQESIDNLDDFKRHIVSVHKKKYYFDASDCLLPFRLKKDEIQCALCCATFPYFHALNKHMNVHYSNYVCETCGLGFVDRNRFLMHQARHEQGTYPCETCGKLFKAEYNRDLHIDRVHRKRGRVYCPKCDARLMSHPQKLKHLATVHGDRPASLPCTACGKIFETRRMLTIHWRKEHLKDFRYECQVCGQKFFTRFALNNHMPTHTGERNFKCSECGKSYPRLKTLKEHMRIHNNDRRYRCHICGQAFIQNCSLKGHMKSQHPDYG